MLDVTKRSPLWKDVGLLTMTVMFLGYSTISSRNIGPLIFGGILASTLAVRVLLRISSRFLK